MKFYINYTKTIYTKGCDDFIDGEVVIEAESLKKAECIFNKVNHRCSINTIHEDVK